jgi:hypothetical protein
MLIIELPADEADAFNELQEEHPSSVTMARRKRFDGIQDFVQALVILTPLTSKISNLGVVSS